MVRVLMLESTTRGTQRTSNDSTSIEQTSLFYRPIVPQVPNMQSLPRFPTAMCILCCVFQCIFMLVYVRYVLAKWTNVLCFGKTSALCLPFCEKIRTVQKEMKCQLTRSLFRTCFSSFSNYQLRHAQYCLSVRYSS